MAVQLLVPEVVRDIFHVWTWPRAICPKLDSLVLKMTRHLWVHDCQDDGEGAAAKGHAALLKFASSSSKAVLTACEGTSWIPLLTFLGSNDSMMV